MQKNMGNDFYDFYDTLIFALLREKIFDKSRKIVKYAKKIVKNAWRFAHVSLYQNSEGDRARPESARKGTKRLERHDKSIDH